MGTLNISSMDLRAVNVPARKPVKPKRPKFTVRKISTAQKFFMISGAAGLLATALLLPPAPLQNSAESEALARPAVELPAASVQRLSSQSVAASKVALESSIPAKKELEPLSLALPFSPTTPSETVIALEILANYAMNGSSSQKEEARAWIADLRKDNVCAVLPGMLRSHETPLLAVFAQVAGQNIVPGADEAIIDRLNSKDKARYATDELLTALTVFKQNPKVVQFVTTMLHGDESNRAKAWQFLGVEMSSEQVDLALHRYLNSESDADAAAQALSRLGTQSQKSSELIAKVESMPNLDIEKKIRFAGLLAKLDRGVASPRLNLMANDPDVSLRAAAVRAMAFDPDNTDTIAAILRNDSHLLVKQAAIAALSQIPSKAALTELAELLNDPSLRTEAKRALVSANKGNDLGWQEIEWKAWIENMK